MSYVPEEPMVVIPIGGIILWPNTTMPVSSTYLSYQFVPCDGSLYNISDYPVAASLLTAYGLTFTQFRVPDLRGRFPVGIGTNPNVAISGNGYIGVGTAGIPRQLGDFGGEETHVQTIEELAAHIHTNVVQATGASENFLDGGGGDAVTGNTNYGIPANQQSDSTGGSVPMSWMPSYVAINFIIRIA